MNSRYLQVLVELSIRLPDDIAKRLDELAKSLGRPKEYIVTKALRECLEENEDYLIALQRLNDKNDRVFSKETLSRTTVRIIYKASVRRDLGRTQVSRPDSARNKRVVGEEEWRVGDAKKTACLFFDRT